MIGKLSNVLKIMEAIILNLEFDNQTIKTLFRHTFLKNSNSLLFKANWRLCNTKTVEVRQEDTSYKKQSLTQKNEGNAQND